MQMKYLLFIIPSLLAIFSACTGHPNDSRLLRISEIVADEPEKALATLDSINPDDLSESNRHFFDFLSIKAKDKAYIIHTSDSLILDVIDYYSKYKSSELYPEVLYYGGRVYRDLGDGPMALRYFQDALDLLPEGDKSPLYCNILSQMGSLLNSMRLFNDATRYFKEVAHIDRERDDLKSLMKSNQLLGAVYLHIGEYSKADSCFNEAYSISKNISHEDSLINQMYLAGTKLHEGKVDIALKKICSVTRNIPANYRRCDIINAYASQIYFEAGILDSAYLYAKKLIKSPYNNYKKNGYSLLLSPELRQLSAQDSLLSFSLKYREVLDEFLNQHNASQLLIQTSLYNYENKEREKIKAEKSKNHYMLIAKTSVIFILVLIIIALYFRNKSISTLLQYHKAIKDISLLRKSLDSITDTETDRINIEKTFLPNESTKIELSSNKATDIFDDSKDNEIDKARELLKKELLELQKQGITKKEIPEQIKTSSTYEKLQNYIINQKLITDTDSLWVELETIVLEVSPKFKSRLYLLAGEQLKKDAYHLALLIKCGIRPTELSILTGRTKGAISSRRGHLCSKIFGKKYGASVMDDIILLL